MEFVSQLFFYIYTQYIAVYTVSRWSRKIDSENRMLNNCFRVKRLKIKVTDTETMGDGVEDVYYYFFLSPLSTLNDSKTLSFDL